MTIERRVSDYRKVVSHEHDPNDEDAEEHRLFESVQEMWGEIRSDIGQNVGRKEESEDDYQQSYEDEDEDKEEGHEYHNHTTYIVFW